MNNDLIYYIKKYKNLIINEYYDHIIEEMIVDLKETLLNTSDNIDYNYQILETFYNIKMNNNVVEELDNLEHILTEGNGLSISNIKASFNSKHDKIIKRDKKWLNSNKNKILKLNFEEVELEVPSDYKVTFEQLLNRHNIFDKIFVNSDNNDNLGEKLRRFEDKHNDLKNGLDNYFRTGTSRREIGMRKLKGDEAKLAVENMVVYCESFLSGKQFLEDKMNSIIVSISDASVKESSSPIEQLKVILEDKNALKEINALSKDLASTTKGKETQEDKVSEKEEPESVDVTQDESKKENRNDKEEKVDVTKDNTEKTEEEPEETVEDNNDSEEPQQDETNEQTSERGVEDRQIGIAVLLTIAEERYFDYMNILKSLIEE